MYLGTKEMMHTHGFMHSRLHLERIANNLNIILMYTNRRTYEEIKNTYLIDEIQFYWHIEQPMGVIEPIHWTFLIKS